MCSLSAPAAAPQPIKLSVSFGKGLHFPLFPTFCEWNHCFQWLEGLSESPEGLPWDGGENHGVTEWFWLERP